MFLALDHRHRSAPAGYSNKELEMWANAQRDGRPAEYRWRPLFNAAVDEFAVEIGQIQQELL